jgi:hypothetical protein
MLRLARLDAPGVLHHVIIRGIERRGIFKDNKDKDNFLNRLGTLLPETKQPAMHGHFYPIMPIFIPNRGYTSININAAITYGLCGKL